MKKKSEKPDDGKESTYAKLGLPGGFGLTVLLLALALALAPWLGGVDIGSFKIPTLPPAPQKFLTYFGVVILFIAAFLFYPRWKKKPDVIRSAPTTTPIRVVFQNCSKYYLKLEWVDFDAKKDPTLDVLLAPGESKPVDTYIAHAWNVSNANTGDLMRQVIIPNIPSTIRVP